MIFFYCQTAAGQSDNEITSTASSAKVKQEPKSIGRLLCLALFFNHSYLDVVICTTVWS